MRRSGLGAVATGAVLLTAAVVGFVVVPEHKPGFAQVFRPRSAVSHPDIPIVEGPNNTVEVTTRVGWSKSTYDALRVVTWALVIGGVLLVAIGLIRYARPGVAS
jgi:hypothetical protein